jgi:pimeloyl-ACP methyl ester carboxylesterase
MKKTIAFLWLASSLSITNAQHSSILYRKINGLSIAYQQVGSGPALVLLHGLTQDSRVWKIQMDSLSKYFTIIAWDAPGAGLSADPPDNYNISDWADCLSQLLDSLNIKQAHILGLSWGGLLAQEFYHRYPQKVLSLILANTTTGWKSISDSTANTLLDACRKDASLPVKDFISKYLPGMFSDYPSQEVKEKHAKIMSDFHPVGFQLMAATLAKADMRALLPKIQVPVLLIWGEADKRSPVSVAHQFQNAIPGATLEIIPEAGHVSNMEKPKEFNKIVNDFCLSLSTRK